MVTINGVHPSIAHAGAQAVSGGWWHSMVLKTDGTVWAAGKNRDGELGDGTANNQRYFVKVLSGQ